MASIPSSAATRSRALVVLLAMAYLTSVLALPSGATVAKMPVTVFLSYPGGSCDATPVLSVGVDIPGTCGRLVALKDEVSATSTRGFTLDVTNNLFGKVTLVPRVDVLQRAAVWASLTHATVTLDAEDAATGAIVVLGTKSVKQLVTPLQDEVVIDFTMPPTGVADGTSLKWVRMTVEFHGVSALGWDVAADHRTNVSIPTLVTIPDLPIDPASLCEGLVPTIVGTIGNDVLNGTPGPDVIAGLEGNDTIHGMGGDDYICAGDGDDIVYAGDGNDIVLAGVGDDLVYAGSGDDLVRGGNGKDRIFGEDGRDELNGDSNDDTMDGGPGNDLLLGRGGSDDLFGGDGDDTLNGGQDGDQLVGGSGNDRLLGREAADILRGGDGDDVLEAGEGDDRLEGEAGNDYLNGDEGLDTGDGGADTDQCVAIEEHIACES